MSHDIGQRISGGPFAFCKAPCEFSGQSKPHSEIGTVRVIAAVTANACNNGNIPKPTLVVLATFGCTVSQSDALESTANIPCHHF
jgi:hypothetical protein